MMNQERFEELCSAYALGVIEPEEMKELEQELKQQRPEQLATLREIVNTAQALPASVEQLTPADNVKNKLFERIKTDSGAANEANVTPLAPATPSWVRLAAVILAAISLGLAYFTLNLTDERNELQQVVEIQRLELLNLEDRLLATERYLDIIGSRETYLVSMDGLDPSPSGFGRIFFDPETQSALLQIAGLPATPADKDYQLWVIRDGTPVSAGVFNVDDDERFRFYPIEQFVEADLAGVDAVAITLEPEGGMPQPTGEMFLLGTPSS
ncbi:MAG: anti-sigma factor [Balneolia bacterium]|nr:anti-sigma factor [Balneolia bacterium]